MSKKAKSSALKAINKYNNEIINIVRNEKENSYARIYSGNRKEIIDSKTAVFDIVGAQCYYLTHAGINPANKDAAANPGSIISDAINNINTEEATACFEALTDSILSYSNNKCNNTEIAAGIGWTAYNLIKSQFTNSDKALANAFLRFIIQGTCILQFRRKPLARSLYIGIYNAWPPVKKSHDTVFNRINKNKDIQVFDDLSKCSDVFKDPIHEWKKYPENVTGYSIDNLFLSCCALDYVIEINNHHNIYSKEEIKELKDTKSILYDYIIKVAELYRKRCAALLNNNTSSVIHIGIDIRELLSKIAEEKGYEYNKIPYLSYTDKMLEWPNCISGSSTNKDTPPFVYMEHFTGTSLKMLDPDCPIFDEYNRLAAEKQEKTAIIKKRILLYIVLPSVILIPTALFLHRIWNMGGVGAIALLAFFIIIFLLTDPKKPHSINYEGYPFIPQRSTFTWENQIMYYNADPYNSNKEKHKEDDYLIYDGQEF